MKTLTDIAVRLRVISTSILGIFGAIAIGILIGLWYSHTAMAPAQIAANDVPNRKWCDALHTVPYISASACGGESSCDRAFSGFGVDAKTDWPKWCADTTKSMQ